ncbi:MAG TPA: tagatose 1,6-diphosphate aldolase [Terriglobales bacterium]|nr:tagatose 1,6-diphosphate aldolase [Terriglobales bacterium]
MKITPGKLKGLNAVADKRGVIAAAAMDQRGSLKKALGANTTAAMMEEFKVAVSRLLTPYASAILLDPEYGLPAAKARARNAGLLLAYEESGYDNTQPGRLPDLLPHCSVRRLQADGADCIKILLYYTPFDSAEVNDIKHAFIERVGAECRAADIPFFLEFVGYDPAGGDEKGLAYAKQKPEIVRASIAEFSKDQYAVDVLKVEIPVNTKFVEGVPAFAGQKAYSKAEALDHFRAAAAAARRPFIFLSAGVSNSEFNQSLALATDSGVKFAGVLCGRATWKDGIAVYAEKGLAAFEQWLETKGRENIEAVNRSLQGASPWFATYGVQSAAALA